MSNVKINKAKLDRLVQIQVLKKLVLAAELVTSSAKALCPVDTGRLRDSLHYKLDPFKLRVLIGTNVDYAPYVEFGTGESGVRRGGFKALSGNVNVSSRSTKAKPFLRPALYENRSEIRKIINGR